MFMPRMNRFDAKHQEVKREPKEKFPSALYLYRMMLHVEELFEFREFRDSCGFEVEQFS